MTHDDQPLRRFVVHMRDQGHHTRILEEASFEAAAVAYVEEFHPAVSGDDGVRVMVRDLDDGHEHCFCVDLESGETAPCA